MRLREGSAFRAQDASYRLDAEVLLDHSHVQRNLRLTRDIIGQTSVHRIDLMLLLHVSFCMYVYLPESLTGADRQITLCIEQTQCHSPARMKWRKCRGEKMDFTFRLFVAYLKKTKPKRVE